MDVTSVSAARGRAGRGGQRAILFAVRYVCAHWLFAANLALIVFATLPFVAPILAYLGADGPAATIFRLYAITCHQMPSRSYFIFGHQVAYCERNTAIYFTMAAGGLVYLRLRRRKIRALPWKWYAVLILPIAIDGFTQLFGWRESTWQLRTITGTIFGAATIWLAFPMLQESFDQMAHDIDREFESAT